MTLAIFTWLGQTKLGAFMEQSTYAFAIAQMVHLMALSILGGAILIVNLREFGLGLKTYTAAALAGQLRPFIKGSLAAMIVTGILLVAGEPLKCYYNQAFRYKMFFLALALLFFFGIQQRLPASQKPLLLKAAAAISLMLWLAVGLAGRAIGVL